MNIDDFMCEYVKDDEMVQVNASELQAYILELKKEIQAKDIALKKYKDSYEYFKGKYDACANMDLVVMPLRTVSFDVRV